MTDFSVSLSSRVLSELERQGDKLMSAYGISRLSHALQAGTRALRDGADLDWIVSALLHDVGDGLAPDNHDRFAAELLRPYVRDECAWTIEHHGLFQSTYYGRHYGWEREIDESVRRHPYYGTCAAFCERWDLASFDPSYDWYPLDRFADDVREVFSRRPYDPMTLRIGERVGLPPPASSSDQETRTIAEN